MLTEFRRNWGRLGRGLCFRERSRGIIRLAQIQRSWHVVARRVRKQQLHFWDSWRIRHHKGPLPMLWSVWRWQWESYWWTWKGYSKAWQCLSYRVPVYHGRNSRRACANKLVWCPDWHVQCNYNNFWEIQRSIHLRCQDRSHAFLHSKKEQRRHSYTSSLAQNHCSALDDDLDLQYTYKEDQHEGNSDVAYILRRWNRLHADRSANKRDRQWDHFQSPIPSVSRWSSKGRDSELAAIFAWVRLPLLSHTLPWVTIGIFVRHELPHHATPLSTVQDRCQHVALSCSTPGHGHFHLGSISSWPLCFKHFAIWWRWRSLRRIPQSIRPHSVRNDPVWRVGWVKLLAEHVLFLLM